MSDNSQPGTPADPLAMSDDQFNNVVRVLNEKIPNSGKCPVCPSGNFSVAKHFVSSTVLTPGQGVTLGGPTYPSIMLMCTFCGNTRYHNAVILGIFPGVAVQ